MTLYCKGPLTFTAKQIAPVGWLMLLFTFGDASPPAHTEEIAPTLSCRIRYWGAVMTEEGYTVHVYRQPPFAFPLEMEVASVTVNESVPDDPPRSATCASVAALLNGR